MYNYVMKSVDFKTSRKNHHNEDQFASNLFTHPDLSYTLYDLSYSQIHNLKTR